MRDGREMSEWSVSQRARGGAPRSGSGRRFGSVSAAPRWLLDCCSAQNSKCFTRCTLPFLGASAWRLATASPQRQAGPCVCSFVVPAKPAYHCCSHHFDARRRAILTHSPLHHNHHYTPLLLPLKHTFAGFTTTTALADDHTLSRLSSRTSLSVTTRYTTATFQRIEQAVPRSTSTSHVPHRSSSIRRSTRTCSLSHLLLAACPDTTHTTTPSGIDVFVLPTGRLVCPLTTCSVTSGHPTQRLLHDERNSEAAAPLQPQPLGGQQQWQPLGIPHRTPFSRCARRLSRQWKSQPIGRGKQHVQQERERIHDWRSATTEEGNRRFDERAEEHKQV